MKKICLTLLPAILICLLSISCENKEEKYKVDFKNNTDEISYVLGAINAKTIVNSGTESFDKLDKDAVIKGFFADRSAKRVIKAGNNSNHNEQNKKKMVL